MQELIYVVSYSDIEIFESWKTQPTNQHLWQIYYILNSMN